MRNLIKQKKEEIKKKKREKATAGYDVCPCCCTRYTKTPDIKCWYEKETWTKASRFMQCDHYVCENCHYEWDSKPYEI